jgi:hypothetical protein
VCERAQADRRLTLELFAELHEPLQGEELARQANQCHLGLLSPGPEQIKLLGSLELIAMCLDDLVDVLLVQRVDHQRRRNAVQRGAKVEREQGLVRRALRQL